MEQTTTTTKKTQAKKMPPKPAPKKKVKASKIMRGLAITKRQGKNSAAKMHRKAFKSAIKRAK